MTLVNLLWLILIFIQLLRRNIMFPFWGVKISNPVNKSLHLIIPTGSNNVQKDCMSPIKCSVHLIHVLTPTHNKLKFHMYTHTLYSHVYSYALSAWRCAILAESCCEKCTILQQATHFNAWYVPITHSDTQQAQVPHGYLRYKQIHS